MSHIRNADGCVIRKCVCKSAFQDRLYGKGNRVHNNTNDGVRCTVCGRERM